jgi:hypothetical protein
MARTKISIQQGDIFRKNEKFDSVWVVIRVLDLIGYPPHVHISPINDERHPLTFSTAALNNPNLFTRVDRTTLH